MKETVWVPRRLQLIGPDLKFKARGLTVKTQTAEEGKEEEEEKLEEKCLIM